MIGNSTTITNCLANYGGGIASVGSFRFSSGTAGAKPSISSCVASSGIGNAIFLAGIMELACDVSIEGDVAIASSEDGTEKNDSSLLGLPILYRTGSIYINYDLYTTNIDVSFATMANMLTSSTIATDSAAKIESFYVGQARGIIYTNSGSTCNEGDYTDKFNIIHGYIIQRNGSYTDTQYMLKVGVKLRIAHVGNSILDSSNNIYWDLSYVELLDGYKLTVNWLRDLLDQDMKLYIPFITRIILLSSLDMRCMEDMVELF